MDRARGFGPRGWGFESLQAYQGFGHGEVSSVGRAPVCGTGRHGFESRTSPHELLASDLSTLVTLEAGY